MIIFDSVYRTFDPDESGVKDISFSVEPGELVMITGHSGSGKTTLMRLLTKEYTPEEGEITFNGTLLSKIKRSKLHEHRRKIGVVFQDYRLVPEMNVWENIALPLAVAGKSQSDIEERVTDLLKLVQLPEKAHLFPSQLSGGEAQRISIARALANAPSVIFADEPTGNLDQDTSQSIAHLLKQINELGTTMIFATHDPKILSIFADERHVHLKNGKIEFDTKEKDSKKSKPAAKAEKDEKAKNEDSKPEPQKETDKPTKADKKDSSAPVTDDSDKKPEEPDTKAEDTKKTSESGGGFFARLFGKKESNPPQEDDFEIEIEMVETEADKEPTEKTDTKEESSSKKDETSKKEEDSDTKAKKSKKHAEKSEEKSDKDLKKDSKKSSKKTKKSKK